MLRAILFFLLSALGPLTAAEGPQAPPAPAYSTAENLLWLSDHLANIHQPVKLRYKFEKAGSLEDPITDTVELEVVKIHQDGTKGARVNFFTGERHRYVPFREHINGNPVLSLYLEGDIHEMQRLTQGGSRYFQHRIKAALASTAQIQSINIEFDGQRLEGTKIVITPYVNDPRRALFERLADKTYEFILSDQIPGSLYQIRTLVKGGTGSNQPLIQETLAFVGATRS
jgi:hypothetical protein